MDNLQNDLLAFALSSAPKGTAEMNVPKKKAERVSWELEADKRLKAKVDKEVKDWNQRDFLRYIGHIYFEATGGNFIYTFCKNYQDIAAMQNRIEHNIKMSCSRQILKDYIDTTFQKFIIPMIGRGKKFQTFMFCDNQYIMDFCGKLPLNLPQEIKEETLEINLSDDLDNAFAINAKYFVISFGPVLFLNYLLLVKKYTITDARNAVFMAIQKAGVDSVDEMAARTNEFKYPKWFPFLDVQSLRLEWLKEIQLCDDNQVFEFLKEYIKKDK